MSYPQNEAIHNKYCYVVKTFKTALYRVVFFLLTSLAINFKKV